MWDSIPGLQDPPWAEGSAKSLSHRAAPYATLLILLRMWCESRPFTEGKGGNKEGKEYWVCINGISPKALKAFNFFQGILDQTVKIIRNNQYIQMFY